MTVLVANSAKVRAQARRHRSILIQRQARRRKCGRERPQCHACVKRGQHCDYNVRLLWQEEVVAPESGSVIVGGARRTERQTYFTSTTVDDIELFCDEYNGCNAVIDYLGLTPVKRGSSSPFTASLTSYRPRDNAFFEENVTLLLEYCKWPPVKKNLTLILPR